MVTSNFTLTGKKVVCVARQSEGKALFDLYLEADLTPMVVGADYNELLTFCETLREELEELSTYWQDAGRQLAHFHNSCEERRVRDDEQKNSDASGNNA